MNKYLYNHIETTKHKLWVLWYTLKLSSKMVWRALKHDWSKYSQKEHPLFAEKAPMLKSLTYGSEEYKKVLAELQPALDNHYSKNTHHPEYHVSYRDMSGLDRIEMIIDWLAATKRHADGDIRKSIKINQDRFGYTDRDKEWFNKIVDELTPPKKSRLP